MKFRLCVYNAEYHFESDWNVSSDDIAEIEKICENCYNLDYLRIIMDGNKHYIPKNIIQNCVIMLEVSEDE